MVGRPDSLQTAPNLHDRMWELDGFGDYMKHSFHFQFIVLRRGITFTQMAKNSKMYSFFEPQSVHRRRKKTSNAESMDFFFSWTGICSLSFVFFNGLQLYEAQFIWSVLSAVVTRDHIILEVLETILGQLQCSLWSGLSRGLSRHKIKTSWQYTDSSHSYTCTTG